MGRATKVEQELMRGIRDDELQVARFWDWDLDRDPDQ
jgi:hypothetical protein